MEVFLYNLMIEQNQITDSTLVALDRVDRVDRVDVAGVGWGVRFLEQLVALTDGLSHVDCESTSNNLYTSW